MTADLSSGDRSTQSVVTGATRILKTLTYHGVRLLFGLPGVHNLALWRELEHVDVRMVGVRHEQTAVYAADGYARATGEVGVAVVTTGPGAANAVAATGEALASGSPVIVIATEIPSGLARRGMNRGVLHETNDQEAMFRPVSKASWTVPSRRDLAYFVDRAVRVALDAPQGPVYLGIPTDFLDELGDRTDDSTFVVAESVRRSPVPEDLLDRARSMIGESERPLIWAGGGSVRAGAGREVAELAMRICAPVLTTYGGRGIVPTGHPMLINGSVHVPAAGELWDKADLVIAIGSDFDGMMTQNWEMPQPETMLAINVDPGDASKNYASDLVLAGDAKTTTSRLLDGLPTRGSAFRTRSWVETINVAVMEAIRSDERAAVELLDALTELAPEDAVFVADMCIAGYWLGGFLPLRRPRGLAYPVGWGTLGFGFPASIGAALSGASRAICVCGDGGFLFACGDLATVAQERLPLTTIVVDDGGYGMLRYDQRAAGSTSVGVELHTPDFVALARSFGVDAAAVTGFGDHFRGRLREFVADPRPNVLVVQAQLAPPPTTSPRWYRRHHAYRG